MEKKRFLVTVCRMVDQVGKMTIYAETEDAARELADELIESPDAFPSDATIDDSDPPEAWIVGIEEIQ